jgi:sugar phosphate permease
LIFIILAVAYLLVYFHRLSLSVVANELIREFQTSAGTMGLLGSIYFYCYAAMQLPAGLLSDSIGPRRTVSVFMLIAAAGSILFGISATIRIAFAGRILVGFGVSMVFIPTMKICSQWYRKHEFAQMAGILNAVGGMGVLAATWVLAFTTATVGWRLSFVMIGVCSLAIAILSWLVIRDRPQEMKWPSIAEIEKEDHGRLQPVNDISLIEGIRCVVTEKYFWPVALWFFFDCGIFFGFGALWSGPYLMDVHGMSRTESGAVLSMIAWGMILGSPFLGMLSDRIFKSRKKPLIASAFLLTILLLCLYLFSGDFSKPVIYIFFVLFSITASSIVVIGFTTIKELFPNRIAGTSVGTVNLFPFLGGAVYMPLLGRILDAYPKGDAGGYSPAGYETLLLVLLLSSVSAFLCTLVMKETYNT